MYLSLDEIKKKKDKILESDGVKVVFASDIEKYVQEAYIDYNDDPEDRGFYIFSPAVGACTI